jgi:Fanconi anemia group J protein
MDSVDIIFAPYNYIIDPKIRSSMNINLKNSIVIVDEAHNTEDACRESTTFQISKFQIQSCIDELNKIIDSTIYEDGDTKNAAIYFIKVVNIIAI